MKIALDAMGGDFAPQEVVLGAIDYVRNHKAHVVLVGREDVIRRELEKHSFSSPRLEIHHATEVIGMEESPSRASKEKKDSSIVVATRLVAEGKANAVVSAGNSGAVMTSALRFLGRIEGIYRPAICTIIPTIKGQCLVTDVGANADCKPEYLMQFAVMTKIISQNIFGIKNPKVGLLSIGEEKEKGNHLTKHAHKLMEASKTFNFIGNVEGRDIAAGVADVVVCDGFVGNVVLKTTEGTADAIRRMIKAEVKKRPLAVLGYMLMRPALKAFARKVDYAEYGGAPLLGVNGICIISHGKSSAKAVKNALLAAEKYISHRVNQIIHDEIQKVPHLIHEDPTTTVLQ